MTINIAEAKSFIEQNLDQVRKAQQVASYLNCSLERLKKSFLRRENLSLSKYIRTSKIARIKLELKSSETPCKVICLELGLREDVGARLFKRVTGMTMEGFRKASRQVAISQGEALTRRDHVILPAPRLILTESAIRRILSPGDERSRTATLRRKETVTQGPAN